MQPYLKTRQTASDSYITSLFQSTAYRKMSQTAPIPLYYSCTLFTILIYFLKAINTCWLHLYCFCYNASSVYAARAQQSFFFPPQTPICHFTHFSCKVKAFTDCLKSTSPQARSLFQQQDAEAAQLRQHCSQLTRATLPLHCAHP